MAEKRQGSGGEGVAGGGGAAAANVTGRELMKRRVKRVEALQAMDSARIGKAMRRTKWECSLTCCFFYFAMVAVALNTVLFALGMGGIGPYKHEFEIYAREAESVRTRTRKSFEIHVHPVEGDRFVSMALQKYGLWDDDLHRRLSHVMRGFKGAALLDLGAHIGFHSLSAASEGHRAVAVEPVAANVARLRKSITANSFPENAVEVVQAAALDAAVPRVCMHSSSTNKAHSFVRPPGAPAWPRTTQLMRAVHAGVDAAVWAAGFRQHLPKHKLRRGDRALDYHKEHHDNDDCEDVEGVEVGRLLEGRRDILAAKVDVEGSELRALRGLLPHMKESPPCYIFLDFHPELLQMQDSEEAELVKLVHSHGYEIYTLGTETYIHPDLHGHFAEGGVVRRDVKYKGRLHGAFAETPLGDMILLELQQRDLDRCLSRFERDPSALDEEDEAVPVAPESDGQSPTDWMDPVAHRQRVFEAIQRQGREMMKNRSTVGEAVAEGTLKSYGPP